MYKVTLFFVPWDSPEDVTEFITERDNLEDIDVYGISMVEAAEIVKGSLQRDKTFHMLRCVKKGDELLETETCALSTGRTIEDAVVLENLQSVKKLMEIISSVADAFEGLK